jgi:hypothetical protein
MTDEINDQEIPAEKNDSGVLDLQEQKRLDRIADRASRRAGEAEKRYDREHDIFTQ